MRNKNKLTVLDRHLHKCVVQFFKTVSVNCYVTRFKATVKKTFIEVYFIVAFY